MKSSDNSERDTVVTHDANGSGLSFVTKACISINTGAIQRSCCFFILWGGLIIHLAAFTFMLLLTATCIVFKVGI